MNFTCGKSFAEIKHAGKDVFSVAFDGSKGKVVVLIGGKKDVYMKTDDLITVLQKMIDFLES
jgi:hypothetical protein